MLKTNWNKDIHSVVKLVNSPKIQDLSVHCTNLVKYFKVLLS